MNRKNFIGKSILSLAAALLAATASALPTTVSFQGRLTDSSNNPVADGNYSIRFSIHDAVSGGSELWNETQTVAASNGAIEVDLGSVTPLTNAAIIASTPFLEIKVGTDAAMTPRQKLQSVLYARNAENLNGTASTGFVATTGAQNVGGAKTFTSSVTVTADLQASGIFRVGSTPTALTDSTGKVLAARIADGTLGASVQVSSVAFGTVDNLKHLGFTCSTNEILKYTASGWTCATDTGGSGTLLELGRDTGSEGVQTVDNSNDIAMWVQQARSPLDILRLENDTAGARFTVHFDSTTNYGIFRATGSLITNNDLDVDGVITAGSGNTAITNAAGSLLSSALSGTVTVMVSSVAINTIGTVQISSGSILFGDISQNNCSTNQVVKFNGTDWSCGTDVGGSGVILLQDTLQAGATFFVSSGTINSATVSTLTVGTSIFLPANSITDAMVSNTLTASDLVAAGSVVADAEVDDNLTVAAAGLTGTIDAARLDNAIKLQDTLQAGATFFVSSGTVNSLTASTITVGTSISLPAASISDAALSANVSRLNANEAASGIKTFNSSVTVNANFGVSGSATAGSLVTSRVDLGSKMVLTSTGVSAGASIAIDRTQFPGSLVLITDNGSGAANGVATISNCVTNEVFVVKNDDDVSVNIGGASLNNGQSTWVLCLSATTFTAIR